MRFKKLRKNKTYKKAQKGFSILLLLSLILPLPCAALPVWLFALLCIVGYNIALNLFSHIGD